MAATGDPIQRGMAAPDFTLPGVDGRMHSLCDIAGPQGTLLMFICNHCPYVKAVVDRIVRDARDLQALGIGCAAINANDVAAYPEDSFDHMKQFARQHGFVFPYLYDESQQVARAYGAVCTPDFFGFNRELKLQYRGRLDESGRAPAAAGAKRELYEAMQQIATAGTGPSEQTPSIGCSIKWKS